MAAVCTIDLISGLNALLLQFVVDPPAAPSLPYKMGWNPFLINICKIYLFLLCNNPLSLETYIQTLCNTQILRVRNILYVKLAIVKLLHANVRDCSKITHGSLTEERRVALHNLIWGKDSSQKCFKNIMLDIGLLQNWMQIQKICHPIVPSHGRTRHTTTQSLVQIKWNGWTFIQRPLFVFWLLEYVPSYMLNIFNYTKVKTVWRLVVASNIFKSLKRCFTPFCRVCLLLGRQTAFI